MFNKKTSLHYAVERNKIEIVKLLLKRKDIDLKVKDEIILVM